MADRNASFFGPVLPQDPDAEEAFSFEALQRIRASRVEADLLRAGPSAWPERRRFETMYPRSTTLDGDDALPSDERPTERIRVH